MPGWEDEEEWTEIRYRVREPSEFDRFRRKEIPEGVIIIYARVKGTEEWKVQALRFSKKDYTLEQAKEWLKDHPDIAKGEVDVFDLLSRDFSKGQLIPFEFNLEITKALSSKDRVIAGYASVDMVDLENDRITLEALKDGFERFMVNPEYRNVMLGHTNIQVAKVLENYKDSGNKTWNSKIDNNGMFIVSQIRDDIKKGRETWKAVENGELKAYSISGEALVHDYFCDKDGKCYNKIDKIDMFEVTLCKKGMNPGAMFSILKSAANKDSSLGKNIKYNSLLIKMDKIDRALTEVLEKKTLGKADEYPVRLRDQIAQEKYNVDFDELTDAQKWQVHLEALKRRSKDKNMEEKNMEEKKEKETKEEQLELKSVLEKITEMGKNFDERLKVLETAKEVKEEKKEETKPEPEDKTADELKAKTDEIEKLKAESEKLKAELETLKKDAEEKEKETEKQKAEKPPIKKSISTDADKTQLDADKEEEAKEFKKDLESVNPDNVDVIAKKWEEKIRRRD